MEQWSILSNMLNYIHYDRHPKNFHNLNIRAVNKEKYKRKSKIESKERQMLELDFRDTPEKLMGEYLDVYGGIQSEILSITRSDLSTSYVGRVDTTRNSKIKAEETFLISEQGYTIGKLLDRKECQILLDTGASKSFISKWHYLYSKSLNSLPKFTSGTQRIQVENGQFISVLFIKPIIVHIH